MLAVAFAIVCLWVGCQAGAAAGLLWRTRPELRRELAVAAVFANLCLIQLQIGARPGLRLYALGLQGLIVVALGSGAVRIVRGPGAVRLEQQLREAERDQYEAGQVAQARVGLEGDAAATGGVASGEQAGGAEAGGRR